jgi:hypothetical protein
LNLFPYEAKPAQAVYAVFAFHASIRVFCWVDVVDVDSARGPSGQSTSRNGLQGLHNASAGKQGAVMQRLTHLLRYVRLLSIVPLLAVTIGELVLRFQR